MGKNPEAQYRRYRPDYSGMTVEELPFCTMPDLFGQPITLATDLIRAETADRTARLPVVIFVHGGGFVEPNDKRQAYISRFAKTLTGAGYAVLSPDYPQYDSPEQIQDKGEELRAVRTAGQAVHALYAWLTRHGADHGLDAGCVALMGGSAGAMAGFYAIADHPGDRYRLFGKLWGAPDPLPPLQNFPPVVSVHGTADPLVPYAREAALQAALEQSGVAHTLVTLDGAGHTPIGQMAQYMPVLLDWLTRTMQPTPTV